MSECLSEAWRGYARQLPRCADSDGRVLCSNRANRGEILHSCRTWSYCPSAPVRDQPQPFTPSPWLARAPSLFCLPRYPRRPFRLTLSMIRSTTTPKIFANVSSTRLITFSLFRFMATNCFVPSLHPLLTRQSRACPLHQPTTLILFPPLSLSPSPSLKSVSYPPTEHVSPPTPSCYPTFLSLTRKALDLSSIDDR